MAENFLDWFFHERGKMKPAPPQKPGTDRLVSVYEWKQDTRFCGELFCNLVEFTTMSAEEIAARWKCKLDISGASRVDVDMEHGCVFSASSKHFIAYSYYGDWGDER